MLSPMGELFLLDSWFRSEFNDEPIAPLELFTHQLRHLPSQFGLNIPIDDPAYSHVLVVVHFERDSGVVLDVPNPVSLLTVLRDEIESSLMSDVPDFYSVRCLSLPAFGSEIEKLVFAVLQKRPLWKPRLMLTFSAVSLGHKLRPEPPPSSQRAGRQPGQLSSQAWDH